LPEAARAEQTPVMSHDEMAAALRWQAGNCEDFGSAASGAVLRSAAEAVAAPGPVRDLFAPWAGLDVRGLVREAVPLRFLGGLHALVIDGLAGGLEEALEKAAARRDRLAEFMRHEPQTNEVRRSACLLGGFLTVAHETGQPLRTFEIGASAGLNQIWDRYRYDLGPAGHWGDAGSEVALDTDWRGPAPPLDAPVRVAVRAACDRRPVDIRDPEARRRLRAYIWADQTERLARLDSAIAAALAAGVSVEAEDAVNWLSRRAAPEAGFATVLFHSVFWQYMPRERQDAARAAIEAHGAAASAEAPFAWLRMEPTPEDLSGMDLSLTSWPGGKTRRLARVHAHGAWVDWRGG